MVETLVTLQLMSYWFTVRKRPIYHHSLSGPCVVVKNLRKTLIRAQTEHIVCDIPNPHHFFGFRADVGLFAGNRDVSSSD